MPRGPKGEKRSVDVIGTVRGTMGVWAGLAAAFLLSGCLTAAQKVHGPDGRQYTRIECNGAIQTMAACYDKANEVCPQGYFLAGQDQREQEIGRAHV